MWRLWKPGMLRGTRRRGGSDLLVLLADSKRMPVFWYVEPVGLLLCADLKGDCNCTLVPSIKALKSPVAALLFPVSTRLT